MKPEGFVEPGGTTLPAMQHSTARTPSQGDRHDEVQRLQRHGALSVVPRDREARIPRVGADGRLPALPVLRCVGRLSSMQGNGSVGLSDWRGCTGCSSVVQAPRRRSAAQGHAGAPVLAALASSVGQHLFVKAGGWSAGRRVPRTKRRRTRTGRARGTPGTPNHAKELGAHVSPQFLPLRPPSARSEAAAGQSKAGFAAAPSRPHSWRLPAAE